MQRKTLIIGLGQIGYANAEYMTSCGRKPAGFDISEAAVRRALEAKVIAKYDNDFRNYNTFIVCVSTHLPSNETVPSTSALFRVLIELERKAPAGSLISVESTIPLGLELILRKAVANGCHLIHAPHRFFKEEQDIHGVNQKRVMAGLDKCCVQEGKAFYETDLSIPMRAVKNIDTAAFVKLAENTDRFIKIAWAEQLALSARKLGIDFDEARAAINDKWNTGILEARNGIGGHCLPKDSAMLMESVDIENCIIRTARALDREYCGLAEQKPIPR